MGEAYLYAQFVWKVLLAMILVFLGTDKDAPLKGKLLVWFLASVLLVDIYFFIQAYV